MSGNGGLYAPGRWHTQGRRIIYASSSLALATLEVFVNLQNKRALGHYVKSRIVFPEELVTPLGRDERAAFIRAPGTFDTQRYGDTWLREMRSCVLEVPSRIVPEESNCLFNPLHPDYSRVTAITDPYEADPRLLG